MITNVKQLVKELTRLVRRENLREHASSRMTSNARTSIFVELYGGPSKGPDDKFYHCLALNEYGGKPIWYLARERTIQGKLRDRGQDDEFFEEMRPHVNSVMTDVDVDALFNDIYRGAFIKMVANMPAYAAILDRFRQIRDPGAGTLYVTFNPILLSYEIHYNPGFIIETMIQHVLATYMYDLRIQMRLKEIEDEIYGYTALMFSHEMEHVLRANLGASGEGSQLLEGVNHQLSNLVMDSVINQGLAKVYMKQLPTVGVLSDIHMSFVIPDEVVGKGDLKMMSLVADAGESGFKGISLPYKDSSLSGRSTHIVKDKVGKIIMSLQQDILDVYKDNSNELTKDISDFVKALSSTSSLDDLEEMFQGRSDDLNDAISQSSGKIQKSKPSDRSQKSNNQQGDSQSSGQGSQNNQSDGDNSASSSASKSDSSQTGGDKQKGGASGKDGQSGESDAVSGGNGGSEGEGTGVGGGANNTGLGGKRISELTDEERKLAQRELQKIASETKEPELTESEAKEVERIRERISEVVKQTTDRITSKADKSILNRVDTGTSVSEWRSKFSRMLTQCLGIKEVYSNDLPSARIEGAFGREEEVPDIKTVVLAIDCSGSMGPEKFKKTISEIEKVGKALKSRSIEFKAVYWGTGCYLYKFKGTSALLNRLVTNAKNMGGTDFSPTVAFIKQKASRFDAMVVFTDGEFFDKPEKDAKAFILKNKRKIIWVLTSDGRTNKIEEYDPACKQRLVKQK